MGAKEVRLLEQRITEFYIERGEIIKALSAAFTRAG
jgi:hypothetical protein